MDEVQDDIHDMNEDDEETQLPDEYYAKPVGVDHEML